MAVPPRHIAFYAPLKAPDHPVPSGDRLMSRQLWAALDRAGYRVTLASELRAYLRDPDDIAAVRQLKEDAAQERARLTALWATDPPDLIFCYHPYVKSPDMVCAPLARNFGIPYVSCEASYSERRNHGIWTETQADLLDTLHHAAFNICLTGRDHAGLVKAGVPRLHRMAPFIATEPFMTDPRPQVGHIVTVAMMRAGAKADSYVAMARALEHLPSDLDWRLSIIGDGPLRSDIQATFASLPAGRVRWLGALDTPSIAALLSQGAVYLWPGCNEAYGLAYLEAQAAGLPVIACRTAGVPEVVSTESGGTLVPPGDSVAMADALVSLLRDPARASAQGETARQHVLQHHSESAATARLTALIEGLFMSRSTA